MTTSTRTAIDNYYGSWASGELRRDRYDAAVSDDLEFRGSIDSVDGKEPFWAAVQEFKQLAQSVTVHAKVIDGDEGFVLYDCHTQPLGDLRFAEHFKVVDGKISQIRLVFDSIKLRPLMEQLRGN